MRLMQRSSNPQYYVESVEKRREIDNVLHKNTVEK